MNILMSFASVFTVCVFLSFPAYCGGLGYVIPQNYPSVRYYYNNTHNLISFDKYDYYNNKILKDSKFLNDSTSNGYILYNYSKDTLLTTRKYFDKNDNLYSIDSFTYNAQNKQLNNYTFTYDTLSIHDSIYYPNDTTSILISLFSPQSSLSKIVWIFNSKHFILEDTMYNNNLPSAITSFKYKYDTLLIGQNYEDNNNTQQRFFTYDSLNHLINIQSYSLSRYKGVIDTELFFYEYNSNNKLSKMTDCFLKNSILDTNIYYIFNYNSLNVKQTAYNIICQRIDDVNCFPFLKSNKLSFKYSFLLNGKNIIPIGSNYI